VVAGTTPTPQDAREASAGQEANLGSVSPAG
jgi:hypothetical protein